MAVLGTEQRDRIVTIGSAGGDRLGVGHERRIGRPEVSRTAAVEFRVGHEQRNVVDLVLQLLGHHRTQLGVLGVGRIGGLGRVAAEEPTGTTGVLIAVVKQAADDGVFLTHLRQVRQQLADVHPRNVGLYRLEFPSVLRRGLRLHVEGLEMARTAVGPEENDREVLVECFTGGLGCQQTGQVGRKSTRKCSQRQAADLQKAATVDRATTMGGVLSHARSPNRLAASDCTGIPWC